MILDLSSVLAIPGESLSFSETIPESSFEYDRNLCEITAPVLISGTVTNIGGAFKLNLELETKILVHCARCSKDLVHDFSFSIEERLCANEENDDNVKFTGNSLDITNLISAAFMSNIDYKYLCSEDCKGLCPDCGADLNTIVCDCKHDDIDPRFAVLKKLLGGD